MNPVNLHNGWICVSYFSHNSSTAAFNSHMTHYCPGAKRKMSMWARWVIHFD